MDFIVSIIVPIYKAEKYLSKCIDSLLGQTYHNLQIILVDDGSPDCSGEIIDQYADRDDRILPIHQTNGGVSLARNTGLDAVKGDFVTFCDADDYLEPDYVESLLDLYCGKENAFVACSYKNIGMDGRTTFQRLDDAQISFASPINITWEECKTLFVSQLDTVCGKLFKSTVINQKH